MSHYPHFFLLLLTLLAGLLPSANVSAHASSQSYSIWNIEGDSVQMVFTVPLREAEGLTSIAVGQAYDHREILLSHLSDNLTLGTANNRCVMTAPPRTLASEPDYLRAEWRFRCEAAEELSITNHAFFNTTPFHFHFARIHLADSQPREYLFTDTARHHTISTGKETAAGFAISSYLSLGINHILVGIDHIAFLLALMLFCRQTRQLIWLISGFTLGHSITLSLAVLGVVTPHLTVVEALIGFSIALVAAQNIGAASGHNKSIARVACLGLITLTLISALGGPGLPVPTLLGLALFVAGYFHLQGNRSIATNLHLLITTLFGLIHGFGFANFLLETGLSGERLLPALLGFNLGVEMGQLLIVAVCWLLAVTLTRYRRHDWSQVTELASCALCGLGMFWFIARGFSG